jgi:exodeoxyribonuclease VII large subunit
MKLDARVDLNVPYSEKDDAKALGAWFDRDAKRWYAPPGTDLDNLKRWLPKEFWAANTPASGENNDLVASSNEKDVSLFELLTKVKGVVERGLPQSVWVRAEVNELRGKNGHLYLHLAERNDRGDVIAQCRAVVWRSRAEEITARFVEATGEGLKVDIKILCLAKVRFDPHFGFDLSVEDVDPSYTLGDLAAKLARIRERLVAEGLYDRNRKLPSPVEYVRVAVISPETSAGLGDFRRETDRLHDAGLCEFVYFPATFQGVDAPASVRTAVNEALAAQAERPFDALVVIRGGGSVTDLAWLNDLELARLLCRACVPVLTGIGHERDSTILEEVAHRRFDTPSKIALHISTTVKENALGAVAAFEQIRLQVARVLTRERTALDRQAERVETGVEAVTRQAGDEHVRFMTAIRTAARYQIREAGQGLEAGYVRLIGTAEQTLCEAVSKSTRSIQSITHRTEVIVGERRSATEKAANTLALQAGAKAEAAGRDVENLKAQVGKDVVRTIARARDGLECDLVAARDGAGALVETARREVDANTRAVVGMGPQATLLRGFAIARGSDDRPITSREAAAEAAEFEVECVLPARLPESIWLICYGGDPHIGGS